jgi:hypothetical protein
LNGIAMKKPSLLSTVTIVVFLFAHAVWAQTPAAVAGPNGRPGRAIEPAGPLDVRASSPPSVASESRCDWAHWMTGACSR